MIFGQQEWHYSGYIGRDESDVPTLPIAENVFSKIEKKATKKEILESIKHGWFGPYYDSLEHLPGYKSRDIGDQKELQALKHGSPEWHKLYDKIAKVEDEENEKRANDIVEAFMLMNHKSYFVVMDFSDNDGEAIEEHTEIFGRLPHIRTSYH
ncbi:MAG: hypothetical protein ACTSSP_00235 [Candidatus Asgardarchaeia archaeon]